MPTIPTVDVHVVADCGEYHVCIGCWFTLGNILNDRDQHHEAYYVFSNLRCGVHGLLEVVQ